MTAPSTPDVLTHGVLVVGTGLMGTSVALALRARGVPVFLEDRSSQAAGMAQALGAGLVGPPEQAPDVVLVAVPPNAVAEVVVTLQRRYVSASVMDMASVKSQVQLDVEKWGGDLTRFVGGHPMAGRERSGPAQARADLLDGRVWVLCPTETTSSVTIEHALAVAEACGADPIVVAAERHDAGVALVSHVPQVLASAMAAQLVTAPADVVSLAGPGVRDMTRIAASDADLWTEILAANASSVRVGLDAVIDDLEVVRNALERLSGSDRETDPETDAAAQAEVRDLILRGGRGLERLPGKHGGRPTTYARVSVVVTDQPGQLAGLFNAAGDAGINVEDVLIEHATGHPVGVVELYVQRTAASRLSASLVAGGWNVQP